MNLSHFLATPIDDIDFGFHSNWSQLTLDAGNWAARNLAENYDYVSDSTIDSHEAMISVMTMINNLIYHYGQTMDAKAAFQKFLDEPYGAGDLWTAINHNCSNMIDPPLFVTQLFPKMTDPDLYDTVDALFD